MSVTDSVPNFLARCSVLGIAQNVQDALVAAGLDTISKYAFSSAYVPGQTDERPFVDAITAALGRDATVGELAALRRLLHESYSMTAAELKQSVERQEDQGVKRLAQPERADRLAKQQARLTGLQIRGYLEPSDRLVDVAVSQYEDNRLSYIEPSACTAKEQEVLSKSKEDKHISIVDGSLRIKNPVNKLEAELGTDLLLKYALTRRGLALDQANLVSFQMHDAWVERLMEVRHTAPPASYSGISHQQLLNADRKLLLSWLSPHEVVCSCKLLGNLWIRFGKIVAIIPMLPIFFNHFLNQQLRRQIPICGCIRMGVAKGKAKTANRKARASTAFLQRCVSTVQQSHHKVMPYVLAIL